MYLTKFDNNFKILEKKPHNFISVSGALGNTILNFSNFITFKKNQTTFTLVKNNNNWVLNLLNTMLIGNSIGYKTYLNLVGLGYSIELKEKNKLLLKLGYSHKVEIVIPKTLNLTILKRSLKLFGVNLVEVNHFAKLLQDLKYPDIYKGKGLYTYKQNIVLKEGKKRKR